MKIVIPVPVYRTNVVVRISDNDEKLAKWDAEIARRFDKESDGFQARGRSYDVFIDDKGFRTAVIAIRKSALDFGVIAHEVMHCVFYILEYVNIPLSYESEEAFTCLNEYLTQAIHNELGSRISHGQSTN